MGKGRADAAVQEAFQQVLSRLKAMGGQSSQEAEAEPFLPLAWLTTLQACSTFLQVLVERDVCSQKVISLAIDAWVDEYGGTGSEVAPAADAGEVLADWRAKHGLKPSPPPVAPDGPLPPTPGFISESTPPETVGEDLNEAQWRTRNLRRKESLS